MMSQKRMGAKDIATSWVIETVSKQEKYGVCGREVKGRFVCRTA